MAQIWEEYSVKLHNVCNLNEFWISIDLCSPWLLHQLQAIATLSVFFDISLINRFETNFGKGIWHPAARLERGDITLPPTYHSIPLPLELGLKIQTLDNDVKNPHCSVMTF